MLMYTLLFAIFLLLLSSNAVKNDLYDGKYTAENIQKEALATAEARIQALVYREDQYNNDLSALKTDVDSGVRRSKVWENKSHKSQAENNDLQSKLKSRNELDMHYCTNCPKLETQLHKETFYRKKAMTQGGRLAERTSNAEEKLRDATFDANVLRRNNHPSFSNIDADRTMREQAAKIARLTTALSGTTGNTDELRLNLENVTTRANDLQVAKDEVKSELKQAKKEHILELEQARKKHTLELKSLTTQATDLKLANNEVESKLEKANSDHVQELAILTNQATNLKTAHEKVKLELEKTNKEHILELGKAKNEHLLELETLKNRATNLETANNELISDLEDSKKSQTDFIASLQVAHGTLTSQHDCCAADIAMLQNDLKVLRLEHSKCSLPQYPEAMEVDSGLQSVVDAQSSTIEQLHFQLEKAHTLADEYKKGLDVGSDDIEMSESNRDEHKTCERKHRALEKTIATLRGNMAQLVQKNGNLERERDNLQRSENFRKLQNPLSDDVKRLTKQLRDAKTAKEGSSKLNDEYRKQLIDQSNKVLQANQQVINEQDTVSLLNKRISRLNTRISASDSKIANMSGHIRRLQYTPRSITTQVQETGKKRSRSVDSSAPTDRGNFRKALKTGGPEPEIANQAISGSRPEAPQEPDWMHNMMYKEFAPRPQ